MHYPFLIGRRIYLRGLQPDDLRGRYFQWLNDQEVTRWMQRGIFPNTPEAMEEYYRSVVNNPSHLVLAIALQDDDRHVGNIGLHNIHPVFRSAEIGILIGEKDVWGQGIATEAISLVVDHAFRRMNLNRLWAGAVAPNVASIGAFTRVGFVQEGVARQAYFCEGEYLDVIHMGLLRSEWLARQSEKTGG